MDILMMALLMVIALAMWRGVNRTYVIALWLVAVLALVLQFIPHLNGPELSF